MVSLVRVMGSIFYLFDPKVWAWAMRSRGYRVMKKLTVGLLFASSVMALGAQADAATWNIDYYTPSNGVTTLSVDMDVPLAEV